MSVERTPRPDLGPSEMTIAAPWLGVHAEDLAELIARQLSDLGAAVSEDEAGGRVVSMDVTARALLRRSGQAIKNRRRVSSNHVAIDRNRRAIATNRRWLVGAHAALAAACSR